MKKQMIGLTLDSDVYFKAKNELDNISDIVNRFLKARLNIGEDTEEKLIQEKKDLIEKQEQTKCRIIAIDEKLQDIKQAKKNKEIKKAEAIAESLKASGFLEELP